MKRTPTAKDRLIVALDYIEAAPALRMARELDGLAGTLKVGSILFTACGPDIIRSIRKLGFEVMLDLKFHDIPSTVGLSCRSAAGLGALLLTVHASGGRIMLQAAVLGARDQAKKLGVPAPKVLAVTVLTSAGPESGGALADRVSVLAAEAQAAGCDGVVSSAQEAGLLRERFGSGFAIACPGIRPAQAGTHDQKRVMTPAQAIAAGADWLVIGRPITEDKNPREAAQRILDDMEAGTGC